MVHTLQEEKVTKRKKKDAPEQRERLGKEDQALQTTWEVQAMKK